MKVGASNSGLNTLNRAQQQRDTQFERIASAQRINSAKDDAAGLAISTRMDSQSRGFTQAIRNSGDAVSHLQTENGAISGIKEDLQRIRELELQSGNGILTDDDRNALQAEIDQRKSNIQQTIEQADFNGKALFGNEDETFQVGPNGGDTIEVSGFDIEQAFTDSNLTLSDDQSFQLGQFSLDDIDAALNELVSRETEIGAVSNRLDANIERLTQSDENVQQANSRIADTDFAKASAEKARADIQTQVGISLQAQANQNQSSVLNLLSS